MHSIRKGDLDLPHVILAAEKPHTGHLLAGDPEMTIAGLSPRLKALEAGKSIM